MTTPILKVHKQFVRMKAKEGGYYSVARCGQIVQDQRLARPTWRGVPKDRRCKNCLRREEARG